ncbi:hypothetical protein tb265_34240 [Gemmatimonadetes bacterium T265]|nr:hypothetical protein tb265_34240 [Gemmatimonadetes bacterium T265]
MFATAPAAPAPTPKYSAADAALRETLSQLTAQAATFYTQPGDQESGTDRPLPLTCGVAGGWTVTQPVGPNGGTLWFGASSLTIPRGALSTTVMISATVTLGQGAKVDFAPHGLHFAKAVTITVNYNGCSMPANAPGMNVYYLNDSGGIAQSMPSANDPNQRIVTSLTDHFSGYMMSWGRM